ncbi:hypothetical protein B0A48_17754 [Cryoendolithus antarcticus]|uniref:Uncharacterized protein n=1 Tax=Cryoendolithus antarcticus TaxID=1507870 RepID=A0A1V8SA85_9PEZI|nr:hypothetical protein B0A48_17754 [Cryoendolithus antarcticus]
MPYMYSVSHFYSRDPKELLGVVNPDTATISCVGHAPSKHRRCRVAITRHNVDAAHVVLGKLSRPGLASAEVKKLLLSLAGYTLCRRWHQDQAQEMANQWFPIFMSAGNWDNQDDSDDEINDRNASGDEDDAEIDELRLQLRALIARKRNARPPPDATYEGAQAYAEALVWPQRTREANEKCRAERARTVEASRHAEATRRAEKIRLAEEARVGEEARLALEARSAEDACLAEAAREAAGEQRRKVEHQAECEREKQEVEVRAGTECNRLAKETAEQYRRDGDWMVQEVHHVEAHPWRNAWTRCTVAFGKILC